MNRNFTKLLVSGMAAATVFTAVAGCSAQNESLETSQTILTPPETAATGTADTKEDLVEIAEKYGSCGNVTYRDDLFNKITPDDFLANKNT